MIVCHRTPFRTRGTALIVVLAFVVLLTVLVLAFFTKATSGRSLSQSAVNDFKSDTLARGALALTVADLKREMANGSTVTNPATGSIFIPQSSTDMVPQRSGAPTNSSGADLIPNLVRRSVRSDAIPSPGVPSRASAASSASPSKNGRYLSAARWNKHLLIPRSSGASSSGSEPIAEFEPPDWVYVTAQGPEVLTSGKTSVIGRYAFAIYDEGGLLDINVAGYPSNTPVDAAHPSPNPYSLVRWGSGAKESSAFADLTTLGLTQAQIDQILGWRNFASAQPGGTFPSLTFDATAALRYHDNALNATNVGIDVSKALTSAGGTPKSDQLFTSRQQLIQFFKTAGIPLDSLQYLGTFSRTLNQPGVMPEAGRPRIKSPLNSNGTYGRGNDAYNLDKDPDPAAEINPPFPQVRVRSAFIRPDGSQAKVGDPLVKNRFPLSRLKQILRTSTASKNNSDPIYRDFGIYRSSPSSPWTYDHGDSAGILRLDQVAAAGREPDFFELLKAAIQVGSLGRSIPFSQYNVNGSYCYIPYVNASYTALHLLQIGANIIDQSDEDGYPTRIQTGTASGTKVVSGVEDLPYLYEVRNRPSFPSFSVLRWLMQPVVWNPHDPAGIHPIDAPTTFRIRTELQDPGQQNQGTVSFLDGETIISLPNTSSPVINFNWGDAGNFITFRAGEGNGLPGFRQPTRLGEQNVPAGSQLEGNTFAQADVDPTVNLVGIVATEFPVKWPKQAAPTQYTYASQVQFTGPAPGINFILEYSDGTQWVEYDRFPYSWQSVSNYKPKIYGSGVNTDAKAVAELQSHYSNREGRNMIDVGYNGGTSTSYMGMIRTDPRIQRWATTFSEYLNRVPDVNVSQASYETFRGGVDLGYGVHHSPVPTSADQGVIGGFAAYGQTSVTGPYRGFQHGYWQENSVRDTNQDPSAAGTELRRFNRDPDGIPRRAMGGYATDSQSGGSLSNETGLPLVNNNFASRPLVLNRPFRSVAELGSVSRGEPWKNLTFAFPESGDSALLDVFCLEEPTNADGIIAGKVNLNTRQAPVIQALLSGAMADPTDSSNLFANAQAKQIAEALIARTTNRIAADRKGPLVNLGDLVGRWNPTASSNLTSDPDPNSYFTGFIGDVGALSSLKGSSKALINRQREGIIRALAQNGMTRTWNLLIDLVAQTGTFPVNNGALDGFLVTGERRYWLHVSIDRFTGEVVAQELERVIE